MAQITWQDKVRVTVSPLTRADKLDIFKAFRQEQLAVVNFEDDIQFVEYQLHTDELVAVKATRLIEICKGGKWVAVKSETTLEYEGMALIFSPDLTPDMLRHYPADLADQWVEAATEINGGINSAMSFFTSLRLTSGKTNSEPSSDESPSATPKPETS